MAFESKENVVIFGYEDGQCAGDELLHKHQTEPLNTPLDCDSLFLFSHGIIELYGIRALYSGWKLNELSEEDDYIYTIFKNSIIFVPDMTTKNFVENALKMVNGKATIIIKETLTTALVEEILLHQF